MSGLIYLIPAAILLGLLGLVGFLWSMRSGQFEDLDGAAERILFDEEDDADAQPPLNDDGERREESRKAPRSISARSKSMRP